MNPAFAYGPGNSEPPYAEGFTPPGLLTTLPAFTGLGGAGSIFNIFAATLAVTPIQQLLFESVESVGPGSGTFSSQSSSHSLIYYVRFDLTYSVLTRVLGYPEILNAAQPSQAFLSRKNPLRHPIFWNLYATRASIRSVGPLKKEVLSPSSLSALTGVMTGYESYQWTKIEIEFTSLNYRLLEDFDPLVLPSPDAIPSLRNTWTGGWPADATATVPTFPSRAFDWRQEWQRYVTVTSEPSIDAISAAGAAYGWADGPAKPTGAARGAALISGITILEPTATIKLKWHQVPRDFIFPPGGAMAPRLFQLMARCNASEFIGCPAGTLLFQAPEFGEAYNMPLIRSDSSEPYLVQDVTFNLDYFNPEYSGDLLIPDRGHNLVPFRVVSGDANRDKTGKYYLVTGTGFAGGPRVHRYAEFRDAFRYYKAPSFGEPA